MTLLIVPLLCAIARLERELGQLWRDGRIGSGAGSDARCAVLTAYIDLHELCVELLRRYLAESDLTPDAVDRAFYSELMAAGLVEDKAAWLRAGEERANAVRELEGEGSSKTFVWCANSGSGRSG
jgi:hypothetical protein